MNAAVFVDFENLYLSLKNRNELSGLRTRELSLQILDGLIVRLRETGHPMVMGRSYAAFDTYPGVEVAHDLALMGLDPQYVLISHSGKNSADVQLALDVARVLFRRADIEEIVIVSGDRDFIPLARQVLEEGRELRVVSIPATTSGDLRERVGAARFWDALDLVQVRGDLINTATAASGLAAAESEPEEPPPVGDGQPAEPEQVAAAEDTAEPGLDNGRTKPDGAVIIGHIPVTWNTGGGTLAKNHEDLIQQCLELLMRVQLRHGSRDIWLSPFLKGPMSQHFSHLVHPERRALINELRSRGIIRVEDRENMYAEHPYSVIVIQDDHPAALASWTKLRGNART